MTVLSTMASSEKCSSKGQAWFCTSGIPSDIEIEVDDMTFHLHKFPLMSKSRKLNRLIREQETRRVIPKKKIEEIEENGYPNIKLEEFPGSSESFEMVAKFCYGVKMELSAATAVPLRCAAEHLEMTEEYSRDNLISKTERFLSHSVYKSLRESIKALQACDSVSALAQSLGITQQCIESILSTAEELWIEDVAQLSLPTFTTLIIAMRWGDVSSDIIESCLICYAKKHIPGILRSNRHWPQSSASASASASEKEERDVVETITSNLPLDKSSASSTRFLMGLLRTAIILNASESCRDLLERKIGRQLEGATLDDLLVPSYSYLNDTLYDVDLVERILSHFLKSLVEASPSLMLVGRLIDGFLAEIASDANLKSDKFYNLAISLPDQARLYDDGLYRAVDVYLKAHPWVSEAEKEKICGVMDCQKLTLEACTHAAQNERLPLRTFVQVLFFEQLHLRHALLAAQSPPSPSASRNLTIAEEVDVGKWKKTLRENQVLRLDMDTMRTRVHRLERECSNMKKVIDKVGSPRGWSITKKLGCKFKTQVCDSQQATMVDHPSRRRP